MYFLKLLKKRIKVFFWTRKNKMKYKNAPLQEKNDNRITCIKDTKKTIKIGEYIVFKKEQDNEKKALVTLNIGDLPHSEFSLPTFEYYCNKYNLDLIVIDKIKITNILGNRFYHWEKYQLYDLFEEYDRLFYIDLDALIAPSCPNVFEMVPEDMIGCVLEDKGSRRVDRLRRINKIKKQYADKVPEWENGYVNSGFFVLSKCHRDLFRFDKDKIWQGKLSQEQNTLNYFIRYNRYKVLDLGYRFNHMSIFSEEWHGALNRLDSWIIHYAGSYFFIEENKTLYEIMKKDYLELYR